MNYSKKLWKFGIPIVSLSLLLITITQDFLAAVLLDRGFYIAESFLFKVIWLLFIPTAVLFWAILKSVKVREKPLAIWPPTALLLSTAHLFLSATLIAGTAQYVLGLPFRFPAVLKYLIVHDGFLVLLFYTLIPASFKYRDYFSKKPSPEPLPKASFPKILTVRNSKKVIPIPVEQVDYFQSAAPYISVQVEAKKYLINNSLRQIKKTLDPNVFVRIHRSTIVNVQRIQALHSRSNGDYDVILHDGTVLRWSRNYHADLKKVLTLA